MNQVVNALLNLDGSFEQLYKLRFKGRQIVQQMLNILEQKDIMAGQARTETEETRVLVFQPALTSCMQAFGGQMAKFQSDVIEPYMVQTAKIRLNLNFLQRAMHQNSRSEPMSNVDMITLQLVQLGLDAGGQYERQCELICEHWEGIDLGAIGSRREGLRELMLHVGFQSRVDETGLNCWRQRLVALSNQRYNSKK